MRKLLNFSTHPGEPELFDDDWRQIAAFVRGQGFDGLELLPVGAYPFDRIPRPLIHGLHLRFFVFLQAFWQGREQELLALFGSMDNVRRFYGGTDPECLVRAYGAQFELAHRLGCRYVVFHPVQCDLAHIHDWNFPWHWRQTLDICSEILNGALAVSSYRGLLLFENLWWPGSFRLHDPAEYDYLRRRIHHDHCGIVLDTAHLLHSRQGFTREADAVRYLLKAVAELGALTREIRAIHLTCGLSGDYIRESRTAAAPAAGKDFWQRLAAARRHVNRIDPHEPFTDPAIGALFDLVEPEDVVFEFTFREKAAWREKIAIQKKALEDVLW